MDEEDQPPRARMSIILDQSEAIKEAPPWGSECELTTTGLRPTLPDTSFSLELNHE